MCSTPNPVENVFCFKCNARLVPMTAPPPEEKPASPPPIKGLSLPAKLEPAAEEPVTPEETDASAAIPPSEPALANSDVPDWLAHPSVTPAPTNEAPAPTSDEPDWLARLRASAPPAEETTDASPAQVSSWLESAEAPPAETPAPPSESGSSASVPAWLDNLRAEEPAAAEQPSASTPPTENEEPSWMSQLRASAAQAPVPSEPDAGVPDWLQSAGATPSVPAEAPAIPSASIEEPDWLKPMAGEIPVAPSVDEDVPDWLRSVAPSAPTAPPPSPPTPPMPPMPPTPTEQEELSDEEWLRRIQSGEGIQIPLPSGLPRAPTQPFAEEEIPDWLRFAAPSAKPEPILGETPARPIEPAQQVPEWIAVLKPADAAPGFDLGEGEPIETVGPIAGLRGVLPLANAIAEPHTLSAAQTASPLPRRSGAHLFESILATPVAPTTVPVVKKARAFSVSRWLVYLTLLVALFVPLVLPPDLSSATLPITRTPAREFFETLDKLATPNATVVLAFEYEPGMAGEMDLQARALARYLAGKRVKVAALSTFETGPQIAQRVLDSVVSKGAYEYGTQMVNLGYFPGNEVALANLATAKFSADNLDWRDRKSLRPFLETSRITSLNDVALVIVLAGNDDALKMWMEQVQPRGVKIAAGVSAGVEPRARAYRSANQIVAMMAGLTGAAQFEILTGKPGAAVVSAGAQNAAVVLLVLVIVVGNIMFLFSRARTRSEKK